MFNTVHNLITISIVFTQKNSLKIYIVKLIIYKIFQKKKIMVKYTQN